MSSSVQTFPVNLPTDNPESWQFAPMKIKDEHAQLRAIIRHNRWVVNQPERTNWLGEVRHKAAISIKERLGEYYSRLRG